MSHDVRENLHRLRIFDDITLTLRTTESQRALESSDAPRLSTSCAILVASRVCVPLVSRLAVMSASPASSGGSDFTTIFD
jgi:hypothetical protein